MIYLDNAATTYPKPECVYKRIEEASRNAFNSGRGSYKVAKEKSKIIDETRYGILSLNNINDGTVVFTPSATLALNQIIFGIEFKKGDYVYVTPFEHNAVMRPLEQIRKVIGIEIVEIPFDRDLYELKKDELNNLFATKKPKAVFCSQVSNILGLLIDYKTIFELSDKYNAINVLDASQGYGIVKIDNKTKYSFIVFAGHKSLYAMFGIAGYIVKNGNKLKQTLFGGTGSDSLNLSIENKFPNGFESGSYNIVAIESLHESINWLKENDVYEHERQLTRYLIEELMEIKKLEVYVPNNIDLIFGIVAFNHKELAANDLGMILSEDYDICIRTGYHCAPLVHKWLGTEEVGGECRVSVGYINRNEDLDFIISILNEI